MYTLIKPNFKTISCHLSFYSENMIFTNNVLNWNTPNRRIKQIGTMEGTETSLLFWGSYPGALAPSPSHSIPRTIWICAYDVCSFKGSMNSSSFLSFMTGPLQPFHEQLNKWKVFHFFFGQQKIAFVDDEKCNLPNFSFFHEAKALLSEGFHKYRVSLYLSFSWMLKNG